MSPDAAAAATVPVVDQPDSFAFTPENRARAEAIIAKYPPGRQASAVLPLLDLAQRQHANWLPRAAKDYVADLLGMPHIRVYEVASFFTMFNHAPVGQHVIQVCTTTPCWLRGSEAVVEACCRKLGIGLGETTADGKFTLREVECLGACANAPVVQIGDDYYEDVDGPAMAALIEALARGEMPPPGSLAGRQGASPAGGLTTLTELPVPVPVPLAAAPVADVVSEVVADVEVEAVAETASAAPAAAAPAETPAAATRSKGPAKGRSRAKPGGNRGGTGDAA